MIHLTPYRQNETSLSPVRGRGMGLCKLFDFLNLGINNKYVTFGIHKGVSGNNIPNFIASVCKASFICGLLKTKCRHIRFNHNHRSRMCICSAARCSASKCVTSVWRKVVRVHRRLLRYGYFPHLALRHLLVKLIEECHSP